ncbi:MAG: hypothetical protein ACYC3Q_02945 [Gemmatimonadaceae bacterium]
MGASTRIATLAGVLFGLSGAAQAQSATLYASATVVQPQVADLPLSAAAELRRGEGGAAGLAVGVTMPSSREYQVELRLERAADARPGAATDLLASSRTTAPRGGRGEVEIPLSRAVVADLPDGQTRARCTIYFGLDGAR